jgi:hypothetical protein
VDYVGYSVGLIAFCIMWFVMFNLGDIFEDRNKRMVEIAKEQTKQEQLRLERAKIESSRANQV